MVLRPPDTPLNVICECGKPVPIPDTITQVDKQTIALLMKEVEELKADKHFLQTVLSKTAENIKPKKKTKPKAKRRRNRKASPELSPRETEVYRMVYIENKTPKEALEIFYELKSSGK